MREIQRVLSEKWQTFSDEWLVYPADDPIVARKGYIVSVITLILALVSLLSIPIWMVALGPANVYSLVYLSPVFFLFLYFLTRKGYINLVGIITIVLVGAFSLDPTSDGFSINLTGFLVLALVVVLAGLLVGVRFMFIAAVIAGAVSGASIIVSGQSEEVGTPFIAIFYLLLAWITYLLLQQVQSALAQSQSYAEELEKNRDRLEIEVAERTSELQKSFDLTSQVSTLASNSTTLADLFEQAVELIQETFHFYHVHIYTYDEQVETLNLAYGPGEVGQRLLEQRHRIELGRGIVGQVARTNRTLIVNEVDAFPSFLPNPLLPETRAEMAVPLRVGMTLLAVLDIQSDRRNSFSEADRNLMRALSNQLAVAINNIHLVTEARQALAQVEELNARLTQERWEQALQRTPVSGYVYTPNTLAPSADDWLPAMQKVMMQQDSGESGELVILEQDEVNNELAIPIKLRGQLIGVLGIERPPNTPWTEDEEAVIQAVGEQIALALESARLFEDTQRNAWRDQVVSDTTARVWSAAEMETVMQAAIAQLGEQLGASEVVIQLTPQANLEMD